MLSESERGVPNQVKDLGVFRASIRQESARRVQFPALELAHAVPPQLVTVVPVITTSDLMANMRCRKL